MLNLSKMLPFSANLRKNLKVKIRIYLKLTQVQKYVYAYNMKPKPPTLNNAIDQLPCLCALIRKAGRVVTKQYDGFLKSTGLRITQYSMLMNIKRHPEVTVSDLSALLRMDQTTVTRNLKVLEKLNYISIIPDEKDQRIRKILINDFGSETLEKTRPSWETAQSKATQLLGIRKTKALIKSLQLLIKD